MPAVAHQPSRSVYGAARGDASTRPKCKVIIRYVTQGQRLAKENAIGGRPLPQTSAAPWPERDLGATYDHEGSPKEFLDAADRICSQANAGSIPLDINVITVAQVNATIGIGEAILAIQELRSRSKEAKKGLAKIKILEERRENL
jgi:hypothetical protein